MDVRESKIILEQNIFLIIKFLEQNIFLIICNMGFLWLDVGPRPRFIENTSGQETIFVRVLCHNRRQCSKGRSAFPRI